MITSLNESSFGGSNSISMHKLLSAGLLLSLCGCEATKPTEETVPVLLIAPPTALTLEFPAPVEPPLLSDPAPGVYKAVPYSMLVLAPGPVDSLMVQELGEDSRFRMPLVDRPFDLEAR